MEKMNAEPACGDSVRKRLERENYLQPVYRCPLCKDTGYVGEPVHEQCVCLKRAGAQSAL